MCMEHRFGPSYMLTEARESGADDVSTWSTYERAPRAIGSNPFKESPVGNHWEISVWRRTHPLMTRISVTALN